MFRIGYCEEVEAAPLLRISERNRPAGAGRLLLPQPMLGYGALLNGLEEGRLDGAIMPSLLAVMLHVGLLRPALELASGQLLARQGGALVFKTDSLNAKPSLRIAFTALNPSSFWLGLAVATGHLPAGKDIKTVILPVTELVPRLKEGTITGFFGPDLIALEACASQPGLTRVSSGELAPLYPSNVLVFRREVVLTQPERAAEARAALAKSTQECHILSQESAGWATLLGSAKTLPPAFQHADYAAKISLRYVGSQVPGWQKTDTDFIFDKARTAFRSRGDFKDKISRLFLE